MGAMTQPTDPPRYEPYQPQGGTGALVCPKCRGGMRTYERNGVHLEQCEGCRGVFLDFGELEHLTALEGRLSQQYQAPQQVMQAPPGYGPAWGHGGYKARRGGFSGLFFSS